MTWCYAFDDDDRPKQHAPGQSKYTSHNGKLCAYGWNDDEPELFDQVELLRLGEKDALGRSKEVERARIARTIEYVRTKARERKARWLQKQKAVTK